MIKELIEDFVCILILDFSLQIIRVNPFFYSTQKRRNSDRMLNNKKVSGMFWFYLKKIYLEQH